MQLRWLAVSILAAAPLAGQVPRDLATERAGIADWLATGKATPATILALSPIGSGQSLLIGPATSDLPIAGFDPATVKFADGVVTVDGKSGRQIVPRGRQVSYGAYLVGQDGPPNRRLISVYGPERRAVKPAWYPYSGAMVFTGPLQKAASMEGRNLLDFDGVETTAVPAGTITVTIDGQATALKVFRFGGPDDEETALEIYFQDATNDAGSYPAGRFVELKALPDGRYQLDFNRARNPFCAYRTVYPCPIPWAGNLIKAKITAGERYVHSGP